MFCYHKLILPKEERSISILFAPVQPLSFLSSFCSSKYCNLFKNTSILLFFLILLELFYYFYGLSCASDSKLLLLFWL